MSRYLYPRRVCRDLLVLMFVRTCPNCLIALQTSFLNLSSRNFTHVFTNIISCTSSNMGITGHMWLPPKIGGLCPPETASLLYRLHFLTDCHKISHIYSQTSSLVRVQKWASQVTCNLKIQISPILMKFKPYLLATK